MFLTRGRLPLSSFLCFVGGFSMGSWLTLFHQLQAERDLVENDMRYSSSNEPLLLLAILILSSPSNLDLRNSIRKSWLLLSPPKSHVKHFFLIGTGALSHQMRRNLEEEEAQQRDLVLLSEHVDNYANLTRKMKLGISYLSTSVGFHYLLKVDDDSFVRLDALISELEERELNSYSKSFQKSPKSCYYWGYFDGRAPVFRTGKWREDEFKLCDNYLPYALGGGYVISKECSDFIVRNREVLKEYGSEDVSLGAWLSLINAEKRHDVRFDTEAESRGCSDKYLVQHKVNRDEMIEKYNTISNFGKLCKKEFRKRSGYEYNWASKPSLCCIRNNSVI